MGVASREFRWVFAGSLVITAGSGTAGLFAFRDRVGLVVLGFVLFMAGYRLSQAGLHREDGPLSSVRDLVDRDTARGETAVRTALLAVGAVGIGYGVTVFAQTIIDPSFPQAVLSGLSSIGGYMFAHVGMNGNPL